MPAATSNKNILDQDGVVVIMTTKTKLFFKNYSSVTRLSDRVHPEKMTHIWEKTDLGNFKMRKIKQPQRLSKDWLMHFEDGKELLSIIYNKERFYFLENQKELLKILSKNKNLVLTPEAK